MVVKAVYLILEGGIPVITEHFSTSLLNINDQVVSGFFEGIQIVMDEIGRTTSPCKTIEFGGQHYHLKSFGLFTVVLVTESNTSWKKIVDRIGYLFLQEYQDELVGSLLTVELGIFQQFREQIYEIVGIPFNDDLEEYLQPHKPLSLGNLLHLTFPEKEVAMVLLQEQNQSLVEIRKKVCKEDDQLEQALDSLVRKGFVGKVKTPTEGVRYFTSS